MPVQDNQDNSKKYSKAIIVSFLILLFGTNLANYFTWGYRPESTPDGVNSGVVDDVPTIPELPSELEALGEVLDLLTSHYLEPVDFSELLQGAIRGMLETLDDPQTIYFDVKELENFMVHTMGSFGGIGVRIVEVEGDVVVFETIPDTPAERAGLYPGDRIRAAADIDLTGKGLNRAVELLRGPKGTEVTIIIERPGSDESMTVTLERDDIKAKTVSSRMLEPGLGYIQITSFDSFTGADFTAQLQSLERQEMLEGLVLDLRNNTGGLVDEAVKVARQLVPKGEITRLVERDGRVRTIHESNSSGKPYPIIVLVNGETASAAEIVAGALRDRVGSLLVGSKTYGKATVQGLEQLSGGNGLKITIAKYLTPSGIDLHGEGLEPDYEVEQSVALRYYSYFMPGRLEQGAYGMNVELMQNMLAELGYDLAQEGFFDASTVRALQSFQKSSGIPQSGIFDDLTWIHFREALVKASQENDPQLEKSVELVKNPELLSYLHN